ncbi:MAG: alpha/beta hydrolase [Flavobacteriales bacterium]|nr:alpha/beta hydrolase [Flavobacteriales bacterium]
MLEDKFLKYKNTRIRYRDTGKGRVVVLIHGFLERLEMWEYFSDEISRYNRVISVDLLGHGLTDSIGYVHTMEQMAQYVRAVLKHLRIRKFVLVGHSMGGYVALALAEVLPDNIKGLCLFHSTSRPDSTEKQKNRDRAIKLVKKDSQSFIRTAIPMLFMAESRELFSKEVDETKKLALTMSVQGVVAALEGMKIREDKEVLLHFTPFPKLMVIGKYDTALNYNDLIDQSLNADNMTVSEFPIGHMGHIEAKDETLKVVKTFLKKC